MLKVISLYVIDRIFKEVAVSKIGAKAQILYLNCLMHHFRDKPAKISSAVAFEIFESDFGDFKNYSKDFETLSKAGLVTVGTKSIIFNNVWGKYIDRNMLEKVSPDEYVAGFQFQAVIKFKDELYNSRTLFELTAMRYKLSKQQTEKLIELFIKEQETFDKKYSNFSECIKHCTYWIGINHDKIPKTSVKSSGKILGK